MKFLVKPVTVIEKAHDGCTFKGGSCGKDCTHCSGLGCPFK